jgi:glyoxylate carboligase
VLASRTGSLRSPSDKTTLAKEVTFGVGAAWKTRDGWKSKTISLGKYLTEADAASFAIGMVLKDLLAILSKTDHRRAEIVTKSRLALAELQNPHP